MDYPTLLHACVSQKFTCHVDTHIIPRLQVEKEKMKARAYILSGHAAAANIKAEINKATLLDLCRERGYKRDSGRKDDLVEFLSTALAGEVRSTLLCFMDCWSSE